MKYFFSLLVSVLFCLPLGAFGIYKGQVLYLPSSSDGNVFGFGWATIMNEHPISHGNRSTLRKHCYLECGGEVEVLSFTAEEVEIRYSIKEKKLGTGCHSGVIASMEMDDFLKIERQLSVPPVGVGKEDIELNELNQPKKRN